MKCNFCSYEAKYKSFLHRHISNKHLKNTHDKPDVKYKCEQCGNSYAHKQTLTSHKKYICQQEPRFVCEICGHRSNFKSSIRKHIIKYHIF